MKIVQGYLLFGIAGLGIGYALATAYLQWALSPNVGYTYLALNARALIDARPEMATHCAFIIGAACLAAKNAPSRLTETQLFQSSSAMSSTKAVGPATPAFAQSTSIPSQSCAIWSNNAAICTASATLTKLRRQSSGTCARASASISVTHICAPCVAKASAIARPMPEAPAVIKTRFFISNPSVWTAPIVKPVRSILCELLWVGRSTAKDRYHLGQNTIGNGSFGKNITSRRLMAPIVWRGLCLRSMNRLRRLTV